MVLTPGRGEGGERGGDGCALKWWKQVGSDPTKTLTMCSVKQTPSSTAYSAFS